MCELLYQPFRFLERLSLYLAGLARFHSEVDVIRESRRGVDLFLSGSPGWSGTDPKTGRSYSSPRLLRGHMGLKSLADRPGRLGNLSATSGYRSWRVRVPQRPALPDELVI